MAVARLKAKLPLIVQTEAGHVGKEGFWTRRRSGDSGPARVYTGEETNASSCPKGQKETWAIPGIGSRSRLQAQSSFPPDTPVVLGPNCRSAQPGSHDANTAVPEASEEGSRQVSEPPCPSRMVTTGSSWAFHTCLCPEQSSLSLRCMQEEPDGGGQSLPPGLMNQKPSQTDSPPANSQNKAHGREGVLAPATWRKIH